MLLLNWIFFSFISFFSFSFFSALYIFLYVLFFCSLRTEPVERCECGIHNAMYTHTKVGGKGGNFLILYHMTFGEFYIHVCWEKDAHVKYIKCPTTTLNTSQRTSVVFFHLFFFSSSLLFIVVTYIGRRRRCCELFVLMMMCRRSPLMVMKLLLLMMKIICL